MNSLRREMSLMVGGGAGNVEGGATPPRTFRRLFRNRPDARLRGRCKVRPEVQVLDERVLLTFVPGSPFDVSSLATGGQTLASSRTVAASANGSYRVVWNDSSATMSRLFNASGTPVGPVVSLNETGNSQATVAMNDSGQSVVAWSHSGLRNTVQLQRYDATGAPVGTIQTWQDPSGSLSQPSVAIDAAGDVVLAYTVSVAMSVGSVNSVLASWIPASGPAVSIPYKGSIVDSQPSVAMNAAGSFVIASESIFNFINFEKFNPTGYDPMGYLGRITSPSGVDQPSVAIDAQGNYLVAYSDILGVTQINNAQFGSYPHDQTEVHANLYDAFDGSRGSLTVAPSTGTYRSTYAPSAAMDAAGDFAVGYTSGGSYGISTPADGPPTVMASLYTPTGTLTRGGIPLAAPPVQSSVPVYGSHASVALPSVGQIDTDWGGGGTKWLGEFPSSGVFTQTFTNAPFLYSLSSLSVNLAGGVPTSYQVHVTRDPGFTGPITLGVTGLPPGVTANISPDVAGTSDSRTITFLSTYGIPASNVPVTLSVSGGGATVWPTLSMSVTPATVTGWFSYASGASGSTLVRGFGAQIDGSGFIPGSIVQFGRPGVNDPSLQAPATFVGPGGTWLNVTVPATAQDEGEITIIRPGGSPITSFSWPIYAQPSIGSLSLTQGNAPQSLQPGTLVTIWGMGFLPGSQVQFGSPNETNDRQLLATPVAIDPYGGWLTVNVPRYAVNGQVSVVLPGNSRVVSSQTFTVLNYRNTDGFAFHNYDFNVSEPMVKSEFGGDQVDITIPTIFFGNIDTGIPSPSALLFTAAAAAAFNGKGACWGMALESVLMQQDPSLINADNGLAPGAPATVYGLGPRNGNLTATIDQTFLSQWDAQAIGYYASWELASHTTQSVYNQIHDLLASSDHPLISVHNGLSDGHVVVAYDLEPVGTSGAYYIDVYDPNRPFNEDTNEITDATDHRTIEQASRIYVAPGTDTTWNFPDTSGGRWGGGFDSLVVFPGSVTTAAPAFPFTLEGLGKVVFGSTGSQPAATTTLAVAPTESKPELGANVIPATPTVSQSPAHRARHHEIQTPAHYAAVKPVGRIAPQASKALKFSSLARFPRD